MKLLNIRQTKNTTVFLLLLILVLTEAILLGYLLYKTDILSEDDQVYPEVTLSENITDNSRNIDVSKPQSIPIPTPTPSPTVIPTPTQVPQPKVLNNKLCINYGHQTNDYDLSENGSVIQDFSNLKNSGINCLRIAYSDWNYAGMLNLAMHAKDNGFRVILGGHYGELTEDDFQDYQTKVIKQAKWAQSHNIDQFSLGNEQEFKLSTSNEKWYEFLIDLASEVNTVYSGTISYETSGNFFNFWLNKPLGQIDMLGFNMYSGYQTNVTRLQQYIIIHGKSRVYVSETNADMDISSYRDDSSHAQHVEQNTLPLLDLGIPVYYFTYSTCTGIEKYWGLYQCGSLSQPKTAEALGIK